MKWLSVYSCMFLGCVAGWSRPGCQRRTKCHRQRWRIFQELLLISCWWSHDHSPLLLLWWAPSQHTETHHYLPNYPPVTPQSQSWAAFLQSADSTNIFVVQSEHAFYTNFASIGWHLTNDRASSICSICN